MSNNFNKTDVVSQKDDCFHELIEECEHAAPGSRLSCNLRKRLENFSSETRKDIVSRVKSGCAPLFIACKNGQIDIIEYLVNVCHADIEQKGVYEILDDRSTHVVTPLWCAAVSGKLPVIKLLLRYGADINAISDTGSTPVRSACFMTHLEIVQYLVENGADINRPNFNGGTCLINSVQSVELCRFLLKHGADVNARDNKNKTPLHYAMQEQRLETVHLLLENGANYNAKSKYGDDALQTTCLDPDKNKKTPTTIGGSSENLTSPGAVTAKPERPKRPSGATIRRQRRERLAQMTGTLRQNLPQGEQALREGTRPRYTAPTSLPGSSGTQKRQLPSDGTSPGLHKRPVKTPRGGEGPPSKRTFSDTLTGIALAIIPRGFPETSINAEEAEAIKASILQSIDATVKGQTSPKFQECTLKGGFLKVVCSNLPTRTWLESIAKRNLLGNRKELRIVDLKDLPEPKRVLTWAPGPPIDATTFLNRISVQNNLSTDTWRVVNERPDPKGTQYIILMDKVSWGKVSERRKLHFGLSTITLKAL